MIAGKHSGSQKVVGLQVPIIRAIPERKAFLGGYRSRKVTATHVLKRVV